jgi:hypothetical protein
MEKRPGHNELQRTSDGREPGPSRSSGLPGETLAPLRGVFFAVSPTVRDCRERLLSIARAGTLTALTDGVFSSCLSVFAYQSTVTRLFQGVAAVPLGSQAFTGGMATAILGVAMHVGVAFAWAAFFQMVVLRSGWVSKVLKSRYGVVNVAAVYGPFVWLVMSLVVIPLFVHRAPALGARWWVQLVGHAPFVGAPIVASSWRDARRANAAR